MTKGKAELPRVMFMRDKYSTALQELAATQDDRAWLHRDNHAFAVAMAMDPTTKAVYSQTVVRWLVSGASRFEDARIVRDTLERFDAIKHRLPIDRRDIGVYASPGDVAETMEILGDPILAELPQHIVDACPIVANGEGWTIFRVDDSNSAIWWADSTQWCTRHQRSADIYLKRGPFHVLTTGSAKWQLHVGVGMLMDRFDRPPEEMPGVPDQAIVCLIELIGAQDKFYETAVQMDLEDMLRQRKSPLLPSRPWQIDARRRKKGARFTSNGRIAANAEPSSMMLTRIKDGVVEEEVVSRSRLAEALEGDTAVHELFLIGAARVEREIAERTKRYARARTSVADIPSLPIMPDNEIGIVHLWTRSNAKDRALVLHEGRRWICWWNWSNNGSSDRPKVWMVDIDAAPGSRVQSFMHKHDWEAATEGARLAVRDYVEQFKALPAADAVGFDNLAPAVLDHWNGPQGRLGVLKDLCRPETVESLRVRAVAMAFERRRRSPVERLLRAVETFGSDTRRRKDEDPATMEDLLELIDLPGSGFLLAGVPDDAIDEVLLDRMISAGHSEVLGVLPGRLITVDRILHAATAGGRAFNALAYSNRSATLSALEAVEDAMNSLGRENRALAGMHSRIAELVVNKGAPIVRQMYASATRNGVLPPRRLSAPLDDLVADMHSDRRTAKALEHRFDGIPPVGRPWALAIASLKQSTDGLDEVMTSLTEGGWSADLDLVDSDELLSVRLADLVAIPEVAASIATWTLDGIDRGGRSK